MMITKTEALRVIKASDLDQDIVSVISSNVACFHDFADGLDSDSYYQNIRDTLAGKYDDTTCCDIDAYFQALIVLG